MFPKKSPAGASPSPTDGAGFSVLGADVAIVGNIVAGADIHLDGKVDGDVTCANLVAGETSAITGTITAKTARIAGTVTGTVRADNLVVQASARIVGDVAYRTLAIEPGAVVEGQLARREDAPAKLAVVS